MNAYREARGFTLVELLIVLTIMGVLLAIAYPSYRQQVEKTRRADAKAVLMEGAQFMERIYSETGCYDPGPDHDCAAPNNDAAAPTLPYTKSPIDGTDNFYGIAVQAANTTTYTLRASPTAGTSQFGTGLLEINHLGQRFWDENADGDVTDAGEDDWD